MDDGIVTHGLPSLSLPHGRPARHLTFGLLAALGVAELAVVSVGGATATTDAVTNAVVVDLTLGATLLVWFFGVRRGALPWQALLPTFLAGLGISHLLVGARAPVALDVLEVAAVAAEVALVVLVLRGVSRAARALGREAGDPLVHARRTVERRLGTGALARFVASEVAALWFAAGAWRRPVPGYDGARRFACEGRAGGLHVGLIVVSIVEVAAVHLVVSRWSDLAAWILTGLTLYGVVWILGDLRAVRLRPTTLDDERLVVRTGLRWTMSIPLDRIVDVRRRDWRRRFGTEGDELSLAVAGEPDVVLELDGTLEATGPFGITRAARRIGFSADRPDEVIDALGSAG